MSELIVTLPTPPDISLSRSEIEKQVGDALDTAVSNYESVLSAIYLPKDLTGTVTVDDDKNSIVYEFENGKLQSVSASYDKYDKVNICLN